MLRLNSLIEVPNYVKSAAVDAEGLATVPDHLFADEARREFPIDTAGHTYLSHAYCLSAGAGDKYIRASIKQAMTRFPEIAADVRALEEKITSAEMGEDKSGAYAVYVDFGGTPDGVKTAGVKGFYPVNTPDQILESAQKLGNDFHNIPRALFVEGCQAICKAASAQGIETRLPRAVVQYGIEREPDFEFVKQQAANRAERTGDQVYIEIAASMEQDPADVNKWAELWSDADSQHGIKYAKHTLDPYLILHSGTPKAVVERELDQWALVKGAAVPVAALKALKEASVQAVLPEAEAEKVTTLLKSAAVSSGSTLTNALAELQAGTQTALLKLVTS